MKRAGQHRTVKFGFRERRVGVRAARRDAPAIDPTKKSSLFEVPNNKKPKSDKSKPKTGTSPYKAAQGTGKPVISLLARKTGR